MSGFRLKKLIRRALDPYPKLTRHGRSVRDLAALKVAMGWTNDPVLDDEHLRGYDNDLDLNDRRIRDAEVIAAACGNDDPRILLEIGTAEGRTTALMAAHAPGGHVHTVNLPPEEADAGGKRITFAPERDVIGHVWRERGCANVTQILANTKTWAPDFGPIDVAFIDGCHDADFVYHDTRKTLERCRPGSVILWHDFCPPLADRLDWIGEVCLGVERLLRDKVIRGKVFHVRDSWVGVHRVAGP